MRYCYCEAKVRSSSVRVVYVVRLRIVFSRQPYKSGVPWNPLDPSLLMLICHLFGGYFE